MFGFLKGVFTSSEPQFSQQNINYQKEIKPLKSNSTIQKTNPNNNNPISSPSKTVIEKGQKKDQFDFTEEYDEEEEPQPKTQQQPQPQPLPKEQQLPPAPASNLQQKYTEEYINSKISEEVKYFWRLAHCIYSKGSLINISLFDNFPFKKICEREGGGMLSFIGIGNQVFFDEKNYLVMFDENFLYMINMSKEENKNFKDVMKVIGNHYDMKKISNIEIVKDNDKMKGKILVKLLFILDNDVNNFISKIKKMYFEKENAEKFLKVLQSYLNEFQIKIKVKDEVYGNLDFNNFNINRNKDKDKDNKQSVQENKEKKEDKEEIDNDEFVEVKDEKNQENIDKEIKEEENLDKKNKEENTEANNKENEQKDLIDLNSIEEKK